MPTTTRSPQLVHFAATLVLGLVLAVGIALVGGADAAWLGFVLAAMHAEAPHGRSCVTRLARRSAR
jgi:hypothetical protein